MGIVKARKYCPEQDKMVLAEKQTPNHILHVILSVITAGLWLVVWLIIGIMSASGSYYCPECGSHTVNNPPRR